MSSRPMPSIILRNLWYSSSDGVPSCSSFMTFLLYVLAFSLPGGSLVARAAALDGAGCGPDLESVSTGGTPRRAIPSRPLPYGAASSS